MRLEWTSYYAIMKILRSDSPLGGCVERFHSPERARYGRYRACLRWDFGFSCAFCLLHEADLAWYGAEGTGMTWIEHRVLRSENPALADDYSNCYYSCRFCNQARRALPIQSSEGDLLDPCAQSWSAHFHRHHDRLMPNVGDRDAIRTHRVYDLDDPRKKLLRRERKAVVEGIVAAFEEYPKRIARLYEIANQHSNPDVVATLKFEAHALGTLLADATRVAFRMAPVPADADERCGCDPPRSPTLAAGFVSQALDI